MTDFNLNAILKIKYTTSVKKNIRQIQDDKGEKKMYETFSVMGQQMDSIN